MRRGTAAILVVAAILGVADGALLGLAPSGGDGPRDTVMPAASTATVPVARTTTTSRRPQAWIETSELRRSVVRIASRRAAQVGVVVRPLGPEDPVGIGGLRSGAAWSTIKVPLALAHLQRLPETSDALLASALRRSDNAAAQRLFDELAAAEGGLVGASAAIDAVLRQGGDDRTTVDTAQPHGGFSTYGQTRWSLAMGTRFFSALARRCLRPRTGSSRLLQLMREVVTDQRWGIGRASFRGAGAVRFKGGWGPGRDGRYLVRQFGIVEAGGGRGIVLAIAATAADGSFEGGIAVVDDLAAAVASATRLRASPRRSPC